MTIKLHRCPMMFANTASHPCWNVQKALDEAGIAYEVVKHPIHTSKRTEIVQRSGQRLLPAIEFEDGRSCARSPPTSPRASETDGCGRRRDPATAGSAHARQARSRPRRRDPASRGRQRPRRLLCLGDHQLAALPPSSPLWTKTRRLAPGKAYRRLGCSLSSRAIPSPRQCQRDFSAPIGRWHSPGLHDAGQDHDSVFASQAGSRVARDPWDPAPGLARHGWLVRPHGRPLRRRSDFSVPSVAGARLTAGRSYLAGPGGS